jgi:2-polyprenyl-3-methyl-5-hydroxy-6-metoxy-1,4-benzoquinol methylase
MQTEYSDAYPDLYRHHWWWRAREHFLLRRIQELLHGRSDVRILDVGCGAGLFFEALDRYGRIEGVESDGAAAQRSGRWRDRIHVGELDDSYFPHQPFDLILMLDVIEHVADPVRLVKNAARVLEPEGYVLITVPAFEILWTAHDDINHHLRRYSRSQLHAAVTASGLTVVESRFLFPSLVVPKLIVRVKEALTAKPGGLPQIPQPTVNSALQTWFQMENAVGGWLPFGTSLLAVAAPRPKAPTPNM